MADYILIVLVLIAVSLAIANIVIFIRNRTAKYTNKYNYMYTGLNADYPRCNCQGSATVPTWGGNVETMAKNSPLNIGVGI